MNNTQESVRFLSLGETIVGNLMLPRRGTPVPVLIIAHGAGEYKENYAEMAEALAEHGIGSLAIDMHGNGASGGRRFHVQMAEWVADLRAAADFLSQRKDVGRLGLFGLSSGGTAAIEASLLDPRFEALILLDPTVRASMPWGINLLIRVLLVAGKAKKCITGHELKVPLARFSIGPKIASDPEINRAILNNPRSLEAFMKFPLPGGEQAFFVNTLDRAPRIEAPTLIIWGEDDSMDPVETGRRLHAALRCQKRLEIIAGNGHVGHMDRHRHRVFGLTAEWADTYLSKEPARGADTAPPSIPQYPIIIEGAAARNMSLAQKWALLSPVLTAHGHEPLAYATLQAGMEYFIDELGYVAYTTVQHPVLARRPRKITLSEPICAPENLRPLLKKFLAVNPGVALGQISEECAKVVRELGFKVNCLGYEPVIDLQNYNTKGNWKDLDLIKRARNEARRENLVIREEQGAQLHKEQLTELSRKWIETKKINDREIWLYARRPVFGHEPDVRKFVAYDPAGQVAGFAFYDPMYRAGEVYGYSANIVRCDEQRFGRLATAIHMEAAEVFKAEGKEVLNLLLSPFDKMEQGKYNDDAGVRWFFRLTAKYGNELYNFKGLTFHKSKYRGRERYIYYASNRLMASNDIYLAFVSADIARGYFTTVGQLLVGMMKYWNPFPNLKPTKRPEPCS
jgi:alpha-beta hydrolase superfamily lysophospholipase